MAVDDNGGIGAIDAEPDVGFPQTAQNFWPSTSNVPQCAQYAILAPQSF